MVRIGILAALALLIAAAIWHPAPRPPLAEPAVSPAPTHVHPRRRVRGGPAADAVTLVYVVGAVKRSGLYRLPPGARIDDAVRAAGGLLPKADPAAVNLAAHVEDGDEIQVPLLGQSTRIAANTKRSRSARSRSRAKTHDVVDVNTASAAQIATVPGIGATIAARIVAVREAEGAYASFDQLLDVAGMTESRLERAQPYLHL
ncbi:MAG TPA: ComEA family DNA-binding protein [Candidatus Baltobacteraceae bacterium]|nr:ComEA family DNA-binding protein [Candidatus Baltobacteraceae bacterium]